MPDYQRATIEASNLLNSNPNYSNRPVNLALILQDLNLSAQYSETITDEALLNPMDRIIHIRRDNLPMTRKLFSIAHEIGHWILHSHDRERPRACPTFGESQNINYNEEQEANAFAAELLMPYNEVRYLIMIGYSVENLMNHFNVSYDFASNRYNFIIRRVY